MTFPLPTGDFAWVPDHELQLLRDEFFSPRQGKGLNPDGERGYILEVKKEKEKEKKEERKRKRKDDEKQQQQQQLH